MDVAVLGSRWSVEMEVAGLGSWWSGVVGEEVEGRGTGRCDLARLRAIENNRNWEFSSYRGIGWE